jgi:hypothetical protein
MRTTRLMLAASGLATVALLASSAAANASAKPKLINGPNISTHVAGYEANAQVPFNEVRGIATIPAGSTTDAVWALQSTINGGATFALRAHFVPQGSNEGALFGGKAPVSGWYLQIAGVFGGSHVFNDQAGTFEAGQVKGWIAVPTMGTPAGDPLFQINTGGSLYGEVHQSTSTGQVAFVEGPTETNNATLVKGFSHFFQVLNAPVIEGWNASPASLGLNSPQVMFTRDGVTEPASSNVGGVAGTRISLDFFNLIQTLATAFPGSPSTTNPLALVTGPSLPQTGSQFGVVGGAL